MQDEPPIGAHLTTPRWGYVHHGIYAGAGRVIHYAGFNQPFRSGKVEEVPLERFTRGRSMHVKTWAAPKFSGAAAVTRARARLGENRYDLWANNCEHFAQWCIFGTSRSEQVETLAGKLRAALDALGSLWPTRGSAKV
jgi:HRAS-like suppressor 3